MDKLWESLTLPTWQQGIMYLIGGLLIYLAISKEMEPTLLLPMGFGAILVNLPLSGAVTREEGIAVTSSMRRASPTSCSRCFCLSASAP